MMAQKQCKTKNNLMIRLKDEKVKFRSLKIKIFGILMLEL